MNRKWFFLCLVCTAAVLLLPSCVSSNRQREDDPVIRYSVADCPREIREAAVFYAEKYVERETEYVWGGQDGLEKEGILGVDCSGFIVRIFQYAVKDTKYSLLFNDAAVSSLYDHFTVPVETLEPGDLIFMGSDKTVPPTHMSVFVRMDDENIYFADATLKEEDGINGVTLRYYPKDDPKFLSYARLLIKY